MDLVNGVYCAGTVTANYVRIFDFVDTLICYVHITSQLVAAKSGFGDRS